MVSEATRWEVFERDNFTCQGCGSRRFLTMDHIVPRSSNGSHSPDNLQTLCKTCNSRKRAKVLTGELREQLRSNTQPRAVAPDCTGQPISTAEKSTDHSGLQRVGRCGKCGRILNLKPRRNMFLTRSHRSNIAEAFNDRDREAWWAHLLQPIQRARTDGTLA